MIITLTEASRLIRQGEIIAAPTEAVYGLSCDPGNESTLLQLLALKRRPTEKGLIVVAADIHQLDPFVDWLLLTKSERQQLSSPSAMPITWVVPARTSVSRTLRGAFETIAVRVTTHPVMQALCRACKQPLVSTSANLSEKPPARTIMEITQQFGQDFPVLVGELGALTAPTEIVDIRTMKKIR